MKIQTLTTREFQDMRAFLHHFKTFTDVTMFETCKELSDADNIALYAVFMASGRR